MKKAIVKDVSIIGIALLFTGCTEFILLPVLTKYLGPYFYGLWAQIFITVSLVVPLTQLGLSMSYIRYQSSEKDINNIKDTFFSTILFLLITSIIASILIIIFSDILAISFFQDENASIYIKITSILIILTSLNVVVTSYFRVFDQNITYALLSVFQTLGQIFFFLIFIYFDYGLWGVFLSYIVIRLIITGAALILVICQIGVCLPKFLKIKEHLKFGLPLTPNSLIRWITSYSDRVLVLYFLGLSIVGIYSAAYTIGNTVYFLVMPLQFILLPYLAKEFDNNNIAGVEKGLFLSQRYFLLISIPSAFGLSVLSVPILTLLTSPDFYSGFIIIPFVSFGAIFLGLFQIFINVTHLVKKTKFNFLIHIIAASVNIALNIILIPIIGILGAAVATLLSYVLMAAITYKISLRYLNIPLDKLFISKSIICSLFFLPVTMLLHPSTIITISVAIVLCIMGYFSLMIVIQGIKISEIRYIHSLIINKN
jgi:O-antigen/teichoic acid export membrane protein